MQATPIRYVPCLRWKLGEYQAMQGLSAETRAALVPLIEVPEVGFDFETRQNAASLDDHLDKFVKRVAQKWGPAPCMVDLRHLGAGERMAGGDQPLTHVFRALGLLGVCAIPVVMPSADRQQLRAVRKIQVQDGRGACLRAGIEEIADPRFKSRLDGVLGDTGVEARACDMVFDLGAPSFEPAADFADLVESLVLGLPYLRRWRTLTIVGASFPMSTSGVPRGQSELPRGEWRLYRLLRTRPSLVQSRVPQFGDYGIGHPEVFQGDMRFLKPSAAVRYTISDGWLVAKGTSVRQRDGFAQFRRLCQGIVESPHFAGADYSAGDRYISACATGAQGTGNLTTWRRVGTSHHLEKVARDLASLDETSGSP